MLIRGKHRFDRSKAGKEEEKMKKTILIVLIVSAVFSLYAQERNTKEYYESRLRTFMKMKSTGTTLIISGIILNAIGIPLIISGIECLDYYDENYDADFARYMAGVMLTGAGEVMLAGGITLFSIGKSKVRRYEALLHGMDKELSLGWTKKGLTLQFRF